MATRGSRRRTKRQGEGRSKKGTTRRVRKRSTWATQQKLSIRRTLRGIGRLFVMAHSVGKSAALRHALQSTDLTADWHPSIGKLVLENWQVGEVIADAVGEQDNYDRRQLRSTDLTDILVVSVILARAMGKESPAEAELAKVSSYRSLARTREECAMTLKHAEYQLASLQDALGC